MAVIEDFLGGALFKGTPCRPYICRLHNKRKLSLTTTITAQCFETKKPETNE